MDSSKKINYTFNRQDILDLNIEIPKHILANKEIFPDINIDNESRQLIYICMKYGTDNDEKFYVEACILLNLIIIYIFHESYDLNPSDK